MRFIRHFSLTKLPKTHVVFYFPEDLSRKAQQYAHFIALPVDEVAPVLQIAFTEVNDYMPYELDQIASEIRKGNIHIQCMRFTQCPDDYQYTVIDKVGAPSLKPLTDYKGSEVINFGGGRLGYTVGHFNVVPQPNRLARNTHYLKIID